MPPDAAPHAAANLLCIGFDGPTLPPATAELIAGGVGVVILFARNAETPAQIAKLTHAIREAADHPVIVCVDQEGGKVQRFEGGFTAVPAARELADGGEAAVRVAGRTQADELRAVGVDFNLAPVLDVDTNPDNPVIGPRSLSSDPAIVAKLGVAWIDAMQREGVAACAKHFPGHGDTTVDSHEDLPRITHDRARLDAVELVPFRAAVAAGVASVMTAHVVAESIDADRPATLSPAVVDGMLRRELGYDGVVISDDLEMKAISERMDVGDAAVQAVAAGVDLVLCCHDLDRQRAVIAALADAIERGVVSGDRVASAHRRLARLAASYASAT
ncbi:MAG: beta-N-acetylhexosaminidase [Phycisphaerales bacterium]|nr:beta-N-acetylhexosaminidase [Phycisphaerae bacterium]NNM26913.1 beta-N-acetylhexosaminidase [Phycisphaerales bacterium]